MTREAQDRLAGVRVAVLGLAGCGSTAAMHLAAAGVRTFGLVDEREVAHSDLSGQITYTQEDVGASIAEAAASRLCRLEPKASVSVHKVSFNAHNAEQIVGAYDIVIDGLDDWQGKILASDACMGTSRPLFHAGVAGFGWQVYTMLPGRSACLRCAFHRVGIEDLPHDGAAPGVFGPSSAMAGAFQAGESMKYIARLGSAQGQEFIRFDGLRREFYIEQGLTPSLDCPDCKPPSAMRH